MSFPIGTGNEIIDNSFDGLMPGELLVIAGRPGMGKSALASDIATWMASDGTDVLYIDLEAMGGVLPSPANSWIEKYIKSHSSDDDCHIDVERPEFGATISELCRTIHENDWASVVFIDYIQLVDAEPFMLDRVCKQVFPDKLFVWCSMLPRPHKDPREYRQGIEDLSAKIGFIPDMSVILYRDEYYTGNNANVLELTTYERKSSFLTGNVRFNFDNYAQTHTEALGINGKKEDF